MSQDLSGKPETTQGPRPDSERPLPKLPEWIRVLPLGTVEFSDQREPFMVDEASLMSMVAEFRSRGIDLVIDYEHQSMQGERAPAAGWIKELQARSDGLWARVDWTQQARDYLEKREYRYFSPVLRLDPETRRPVALLHMGLTNVPALKHLGLFPAYPPPIGDLLAGKVERPLSTNAADPQHENAAGKKLCGMCGHKVRGKGWRCSKLNLAAYGPGLPTFPCPAPNLPLCPGFLKKPSTPRPPQPKKKGLPVPPGVKLLYFGRPLPGMPRPNNLGHQGVVTVAWIEPTPGTLHLGFSFCSPKDPWCKATGGDIALTRLLHPVVIPFLYSPRRTVHEVARAIMSHDFVRLAALSPGATMWRAVPSWTKALAKRLMGGTEQERRGRGKTLGEKLAWLRTHGLNLSPPPLTGFPFSIASIDKIFRPPLEVELPLTIIARMMRDIASLGSG